MLKHVLREIIDESDVFVDVHKAIRRLAPAPKSRVPRGRFIEHSAHRNEDGVPELDGEQAEHVEAPPPRFQIRLPNSSKNPDSGDQLVTHVGTTDKIREHLKHLGPSNLASRPRQTRYQNVKIKRGRGSPSRSSTDIESTHSASDARSHVNSSTPLLQPADGDDAGTTTKQPTKSYSFPTLSEYADGSRAPASSTTPLLPQAESNGTTEYGSMLTKDAATDNHGIANRAVPDIPEAVKEEEESQSRQGQVASPHSSVHGSVNTKGAAEQKRDESSPGRTATPTRSGAITEQVLDVNGVRKVVLHATSSSSSDNEAGASKQRADEGHEREEQQTRDSNKNTGNTDGQSSRKKRRKWRKSKSGGSQRKGQK